MSHNITVEGGKSVRLKTAGKYCDRDIVVTSKGSSASFVLQDKTVTPSTSKQSIKADSGYDGLDTVTINAVPTAELASPLVSVDNEGLITVTVTQDEGYVESGKKTNTYQLLTQEGKLITPTKESQLAVRAQQYTTGHVYVAPIPDDYIIPSGKLQIASNGTHDVTDYESVEVNVSAGGVASATVTIDVSDSTSDIKRIYFTEPNMITGVVVLQDDNTKSIITVAKGSLLFIEAVAFDWDLSGNVLIASTNLQSYTLFYIQGDCEISAWSM